MRHSGSSVTWIAPRNLSWDEVIKTTRQPSSKRRDKPKLTPYPRTTMGDAHARDGAGRFAVKAKAEAGGGRPLDPAIVAACLARREARQEAACRRRLERAAAKAAEAAAIAEARADLERVMVIETERRHRPCIQAENDAAAEAAARLASARRIADAAATPVHIPEPDGPETWHARVVRIVAKVAGMRWGVSVAGALFDDHASLQARMDLDDRTHPIIAAAVVGAMAAARSDAERHALAVAAAPLAMASTDIADAIASATTADGRIGAIARAVRAAMDGGPDPVGTPTDADTMAMLRRIRVVRSQAA